jgi:hypothetical protein
MERIPMEVGDDAFWDFPLSAYWCTSIQLLLAYVNQPKVLIVTEGLRAIIISSNWIKWLQDWREILGGPVEGICNSSRNMWSQSLASV